jgi:hypothetical protein
MLEISCFTSTYILPGYTDKKEKKKFSTYKKGNSGGIGCKVKYED